MGKIFTEFLHVYNSLWPLEVKVSLAGYKILGSHVLSLNVLIITLHCLWHKALMLKSLMTI